MKRKMLSITTIILLMTSFTGCNSKDKEEIKALQNQINKLEQQISKTEDKASSNKKEVTTDNKDDNTKTESKDNKETNKKQLTQFDKGIDPNFICDICDSKGVCNEMTCFNSVICEECTAMLGKSKSVEIKAENGTHYSCKEHVDLVKLFNEYCGCRSCGVSIMFKKDRYDLGGDSVCKDCYDEIIKEAPYGYCDNIDCGSPLPANGHCTNCGDYYSGTQITTFNCDKCNNEITTEEYYNGNGWCMSCIRACPVPGCGGDFDFCDCPSDLQEQYR